MTRIINRDWTPTTDEEMRRGYEEMAADKEREAEALEWCESHVGECLEDDEDWTATDLIPPPIGSKP